MPSNDFTIPSVARQNQVEFLFELYSNGFLLDDASIEKLKIAGYISEKLEVASSFTPGAGAFAENRKWKEKMHVPTALPKDDFIDVQLADNFRAVGLATNVVIKASDWKPKSLIYHREDFVKWIDSINSDYSKVISYQPFELYKQQADQWYAENVDVMEEGDPNIQYDLMIRELDRCAENSMYALNKYYYHQAPGTSSGRSKFYMTDYYEHQRIICFLFDSGYSFFMGKPRQFGGTTLFGMLSINRLLSRANYFIKFITEDDKKGREIFEDKIKFAFYSLPKWYIPQTNGKPDVLNDRDNLFKLGRKEGKGNSEGLNSKMSVVPPTTTAINGGTPPLVLIDEIGSIDILSPMINEGRPTMFIRDPVTGKMELKNQVVGWGTGTTSKGGAAFEKEFRKAMAAWKAGDYSYGFIPLFFDWTTRCDEEEYLKQKRYYYGSRSVEEGIDAETSKIQFHQHFPSQVEDMFSSTKKTLVSRELIDSNIRKIDNVPELQKCLFGYFEPIFDKSKSLDNPHVPFRIIGAEFVSINEEDPRVTTVLFQKPKDWVDRYYAGTDPISNDNGISNMSTTIYDKLFNTTACLVNFRLQNDPAYSFIQSALACLYYDTRREKFGVKELIEKNIGLAYKQFKENIGLGFNLIYEAELPAALKSGSTGIGVDNKSHRNRIIINYMAELFNTFGSNIYIRDYWVQHRTFVCTTTRAGADQWGSVDPRYYKDDALFSATYAYIAAISNFDIPRSLEEQESFIKSKYVLVYDQNFNMIRKPVVHHVDKNN